MQRVAGSLNQQGRPAAARGAAPGLRRLLDRLGARFGRCAAPDGAVAPVAETWDRHRRRSTRQYARRTALLADVGRDAIRCRVADMSAHGMRLLLPDGASVLPATFSLVLVESGIIYRVRRVWRRRMEVGVEFQASETLLDHRTEDLYFDLMRRVPSLSAWEIR